MLKGIYLVRPEAFAQIYGPQEQTDIAALVEMVAPPLAADTVRDHAAVLASVEVICGGWEMPVLDAEFLAHVPNLRAVFYGAGSIRHYVTDAFWAKQIPISSAYAANAVPVAEYTLSQILFCLKRGWQHALAIKRAQRYGEPPRLSVPGAFGSTVGIVSLGMIGRMVCRHLQRFDLRVLAYDPFATGQDAAELQVELCSLDDLFRRADLVSLHTPLLPETVGLITGDHLAAMKLGATLINTARGAIVREAEMIAVLAQRPDLFALLDVTDPEPPQPGSPLYTLDNVVLTPHIAGSLDDECRRMGRIVVDELRRFVAGEPLQWIVGRAQADHMA